VRQAEGLLPGTPGSSSSATTPTVRAPPWPGDDLGLRLAAARGLVSLPPELLYKEGVYVQQPWTKSVRPLEISDTGAFLADPQKRYYYRMLANYCCPILDLGHFGMDLQAIDRIAQANRDFGAVQDLMQVRHLLGDKGVEWSAPQGRAVLAFDAVEYLLRRG